LVASLDQGNSRNLPLFENVSKSPWELSEGFSVEEVGFVKNQRAKSSICPIPEKFKVQENKHDSNSI